MRWSIALLACLTGACLSQRNQAFGVHAGDDTTTATTTTVASNTTTVDPATTSTSTSDGTADATADASSDPPTTSTSTTTTTSATTTPTECEPKATQPCYTGPPATRHVGTCIDGVQECDNDGAWGPCKGDLPPAPKDDCSTPGDENCDNIVNDGCIPECEPGMVAPCYTGPDGTNGVGKCHGGEWQCDPNGFWGECADQVVPLAEDCNTDQDEDCDGEGSC